MMEVDKEDAKVGVVVYKTVDTRNYKECLDYALEFIDDKLPGKLKAGGVPEVAIDATLAQARKAVSSEFAAITIR